MSTAAPVQAEVVLRAVDVTKTYGVTRALKGGTAARFLGF